jgi:hypothetical protein
MFSRKEQVTRSADQLMLCLYYRTYIIQMQVGFMFGLDDARVYRIIKKLELIVARIVAIKKNLTLNPSHPTHTMPRIPEPQGEKLNKGPLTSTKYTTPSTKRQHIYARRYFDIPNHQLKKKKNWWRSCINPTNNDTKDMILFVLIAELLNC